jgi:uncharacterized protein (DUF2249 family)
MQYMTTFKEMFLLSGKVLIFSIILLGCSKSFAQDAFQLQWQKTYGAGTIDKGEDIVVADDGSYYVTGYYQGLSLTLSPTITLSSAVAADNAFAIKYNTNGEIVWAKNITKARGFSIGLDDAGDVYIGGTYKGDVYYDASNESILSSPVKTKGFVLKLDASGNYLWAIDFSSGVLEIDMAVDKNGDVAVTGTLQGTGDFDPSAETVLLTATNLNAPDIFLAKYNREGQYVWAFAIGGEYWDTTYAVTFDNLNNIYIGGKFEGVVDFDPSVSSYPLSTFNHLQGCSFLAKYNQSGEFLWAKKGGGSTSYLIDSYGITTSIAVDSENNLLTIIFFKNLLVLEENNPAATFSTAGGAYVYDRVIAKHSAQGEFIWAKKFNYSPSPRDIAIGKMTKYI